MTQIGTHGFALAFDTALTLQEMLSNLNLQLPQWEWIDWQNDRWGDYIRGIAKTDGDASFKILYDDEIQRWAINVSFQSILAAAEAISPRFRTLTMSRVLPVVDAKNITALDEDYSS